MDVDRLLVLVQRLVVAEQLQELAPRVDPTRAAMARWRRISNSVGVRLIRRAPRWTRRRSRSITRSPWRITRPPAASARSPYARRSSALIRLISSRSPNGLVEVVVGPQLEADHLVDLVVAGGQDQDRRLRSCRAQPAEHLEPVHAGQADVEHDEVRCLVRREVQALLAGPRDGDLVALLLEGVLDSARDGELVLDDQDRGSHGRPMLHRPPPAGLIAPIARTAERYRFAVAIRAADAVIRCAPFRAPRPAPVGESRPLTRTSRGSNPMSTATPTRRASPPSRARSPARRSPASAATGRLPAVVYRPRRSFENVSRRRPRVRPAPPERRGRTR